jgi:hypothetical protein
VRRAAPPVLRLRAARGRPRPGSRRFPPSRYAPLAALCASVVRRFTRLAAANPALWVEAVVAPPAAAMAAAWCEGVASCYAVGFGAARGGEGGAAFAGGGGGGAGAFGDEFDEADQGAEDAARAALRVRDVASGRKRRREDKR